MEPINIIVCGGRVGRNLTEARVWLVLDKLAESWPKPFRIVHGGAKWVDSWAGRWGYSRGHQVQPVPVDGRLDGFKDNAPFKRNERMQEHFPATYCVGFPGGGGTNSMMEICHDAGVEVIDIEFYDDGTWEAKRWATKLN
jgi:hypothetical protein